MRVQILVEGSSNTILLLHGTGGFLRHGYVVDSENTAKNLNIPLINYTNLMQNLQLPLAEKHIGPVNRMANRVRRHRVCFIVTVSTRFL